MQFKYIVLFEDIFGIMAGPTSLPRASLWQLLFCRVRIIWGNAFNFEIKFEKNVVSARNLL